MALGQANIAIGEYEKAKTEARGDSGKDDDKSKKSDKEDKEVKLHPFDIAMGAPAPKKPDEKDKDDKYSPKAGYILAAIFAMLYVAGRILEPWLIKSTFRKKLSGIPLTRDANPIDQVEA